MLKQSVLMGFSSPPQEVSLYEQLRLYALPLSSLNEYSNTTDRKFEIFSNAVLLDLWIKEPSNFNALTKANRQRYATGVWNSQKLTRSAEELASFCSSTMLHFVNVETTLTKKKEAPVVGNITQQNSPAAVPPSQPLILQLKPVESGPTLRDYDQDSAEDYYLWLTGYEFKCAELHPWATSPSGGKFWEFLVSATRFSGLKIYRANIVEVMQSYTRHTKEVSTARWRTENSLLEAIKKEASQVVAEAVNLWIPTSLPNDFKVQVLIAENCAARNSKLNDVMPLVMKSLAQLKNTNRYLLERLRSARKQKKVVEQTSSTSRLFVSDVPQSLNDTLDELERCSQQLAVTRPVSFGDLARLTCFLYANPLIALKDLPAEAGATATTWSPLDWNSFKALLLKYIPVVIFQTAVIMDSFVVANFGSSLSSTTAWVAMLESAAMSAEFKDELKVVSLRLPAANTKPITHEIFDQIVPTALAYARSRKWEAQRRRRTTTSTTGNDVDGFRVIDLLYHLYETIPGLYEHGFSKSAVYRLFQPARTNSIDAKSYHRVIDARVSKKSNSARAMSEGTHFARAQQRLLQEWFTFHRQLCVSGDDMNIIQVGRPAVSRYHQQRRFFMNGEGPDHKTHDFPSSHLGIKLGGFMMLHSSSRIPTSKRRSSSVHRDVRQ